jgi:thiamine-phosphate pyrophosphorylase
MSARYPLPRTWLLTDERQGDALWPAVNALPQGSGVIVRHYSLGNPDRHRLFTRIRQIARRRKLVVLLSGTPDQAQRWKADGVYSAPAGRPAAGLLWAATAHDLKEIRQAERRGADLILLSPLFPTRSHPSGKPLGAHRFARLAGATRLPVIALGGVEPRHFRLLERIAVYGWAGIDAFIPKAIGTIRT